MEKFCAMPCSATQSCPTLCSHVDYSLPGSSVHGVSQARILEWVAVSSSEGSSQPGDQIHISCIGRQVLFHRATCEALNGKITLSKLVHFQPCYSLVNLAAEGRKVVKKSTERATDPGREKRRPTVKYHKTLYIIRTRMIPQFSEAY